MHFFNIDLHIGVIGDIRNILQDQGHQVTDWTLSGHAWVLGRQPTPIDVINRENWQEIDDSMCDAFYKRYRDELNRYDAFIVTHTPCFAMLFARWEKPIITVASTRYENPFAKTPGKWLSFNRFLRRSIDSGLVVPLANNKYDAAYAKLFTQREWQVIPSLCAYTGAIYSGRTPKFLYSSKYKGYPLPSNLVDRDRFHPDRLQRILARIGVPQARRGFTWQEIADFKGVVHVPYNTSIMSIFEQYWANIPLFFPSAKFLADLYSRYHNQGVLSELSFNGVFGLPPGSTIDTNGVDPNNYLDFPTMNEWIRLADFYDDQNMPHIQLFDAFSHLEALLESTDLGQVSEAMRSHNQIRKSRVHGAWADLLARI